jgi:hypothetical protein
VPGEDGQGQRNGKVLKFVKDGPTPTRAVNVFNNSWYLRAPVAAEGRTTNLCHWNNAIKFCDPALSGPALRRSFESAGSTSTILFLDNFSLNESLNDTWFDYDHSDHPDFPKLIQDMAPDTEGTEKFGLSTGIPFIDPSRRDFRMTSADWAEAGRTPPWQQWPSPYQGQRPPVGAYEDGSLVEGPPYFHCGFDQPDTLSQRCRKAYDEPPRIIGQGWRGAMFEIRFSVPVSFGASHTIRVEVAAKSYESAACRIAGVPAGTVLACPFPDNGPPTRRVSGFGDPARRA